MSEQETPSRAARGLLFEGSAVGVVASDAVLHRVHAVLGKVFTTYDLNALTEPQPFYNASVALRKRLDGEDYAGCSVVDRHVSDSGDVAVIVDDPEKDYGYALIRAYSTGDVYDNAGFETEDEAYDFMRDEVEFPISDGGY